MANGQYILDGKTPVEAKSTMQWAEWFEKATKDGTRVVKQSHLPNNVMVSTVFLGIDHNFLSKGDPILFETMIFGGGNEFQERYSTWDEAEEGHNRVLHEYFKVDSDVR